MRNFLTRKYSICTSIYSGDSCEQDNNKINIAELTENKVYFKNSSLQKQIWNLVNSISDI